jgi:hypothetical protein
MTDWTYVDQLIPLIESTWDQVGRAVAGGATDIDSVRKQVNLDRFRGLLAGSDERLRRGFESLFARPAVEAAFRELRPDSARKS